MRLAKHVARVGEKKTEKIHTDSNMNGSTLLYHILKLAKHVRKENIAKNIWPNTRGGMLTSQME